MKKILTPKYVISLSILLAADTVVFGGTNPQEAPSFMLIVGFVLFCATAYSVFEIVTRLISLYGLPVRHKRRFLKAATALLAGLVALQSIGQLAARDAVVLSLLTLLFYLYTTYAKGTRQHAGDKQQQV